MSKGDASFFLLVFTGSGALTMMAPQTFLLPRFVWFLVAIFVVANAHGAPAASQETSVEVLDALGDPSGEAQAGALLASPFDNQILERVDDEFKQELLASKVDFLLENMVAVTTSSDVTLQESQRFARSGKFLAEHYYELSSQQKDTLMRCLVI